MITSTPVSSPLTVPQNTPAPSAMSDQDAEGIEVGDYTITTVATSTAAYVTFSPSEESIMTASFGSEEAASDNYQAPQHTAVVTTTAAVPINNEKKYCTWVNDGGAISFTWE